MCVQLVVGPIFVPDNCGFLIILRTINSSVSVTTTCGLHVSAEYSACVNVVTFVLHRRGVGLHHTSPIHISNMITLRPKYFGRALHWLKFFVVPHYGVFPSRKTRSSLLPVTPAQVQLRIISN